MLYLIIDNETGEQIDMATSADRAEQACQWLEDVSAYADKVKHTFSYRIANNSEAF